MAVVNKKAWICIGLGALLGLGVGWMAQSWGTWGFSMRLAQAASDLDGLRQRQTSPQRFEQEQERWRELLQTPDGTPNQYAWAWDGLGDTQYLSGAYEQAVESYRQSLRWNPGDERVREDLLLAAKAARSHQPPQQGQPPQNSPAPGEGDGAQPPQSGAQPPSDAKAPPEPPAQNKQEQQPPSAGAGNGAGLPPQASPSPSPSASATPRDDTQRLLRHLRERERDMNRPTSVRRDLQPPRGTETW